MVKKKVKRVVKKAKAKKRAKGLKVLPRKMSALIKIALADIRKAEKSEKFIINMSEWYDSSKEVLCTLSSDEFSDEATVVSKYKVCVACAAGSVMAFSLGFGSGASADKVSDVLHSDKNGAQLSAIDDLRRGSVTSAATELGLAYASYDGLDYCKGKKPVSFFNKFNMIIPYYAMENPEPFHAAMGKLQAKLEKAGL